MQQISCLHISFMESLLHFYTGGAGLRTLRTIVFPLTAQSAAQLGLHVAATAPLVG